MENNICIVMEGMTASGKTTAVNLLSQKLGLRVVPEEFRDSHDLLKRFHSDNTWAFPMQLQFVVNRYVQLLCSLEDPQPNVMDRSLLGDSVYANLYYELGYFDKEQYNAYTTLWKALVTHVKPTLLVILTCSLETSLARITARGREDEITAGEGYWRNLHMAYGTFLSHMHKHNYLPMLVVDTDQENLLNDNQAMLRFTDKVQSYIS